MQHFKLYLLRQRRRKPLDVKLLGVQSHRLNKYLMTGLVLKGHYLRLDARTVAGSYALDDAGVYRTAVEIFTDYSVPTQTSSTIIVLSSSSCCDVISAVLSSAGTAVFSNSFLDRAKPQCLGFHISQSCMESTFRLSHRYVAREITVSSRER